MASKKLTEYERKRLENIKRNEQMLASFNIKSTASQLTSISKCKRQQIKSYKLSPEKKQKTEEPVVLRRSSRIRGVKPDASTVGGLPDDFHETPHNMRPKRGFEPASRGLCRESEPFSMSDAYRGEGSSKELIDLIRSFSIKLDEKEETGSRTYGAVNLCDWDLKPENVARVVPGKIQNVKFFPTTEKTLVVAGNKFGDLGLWNVGAAEEEGDGIYMYKPHSAPVSGIVIDPFSMSKMFTSCYDGFIRVMDIEKEMFDFVYIGDHAVYSIAGRPQDSNSLYFTEGTGEFHMWDLRVGKSSAMWNLHESRISTIDFNFNNTNLLATSGSNGTACIWDLRNIRSNKSEPLNVIRHKHGVQSAYFSPSGKSLLTTSLDSTVGVSSGANYEDVSMIPHNNFTGRWIPTFRGIWGWDDSHIYIGNMKRGVDIINAAEKRIIATLESENMTAIPCRFDAHQYNVGMLAGATAGGQVYVWTSVVID
ncbi:hypothetical protein Leryth_026547 [Lithospermum erythrorhizon]|nr:hypothetical protein Leryth_026547 [Lithospermum erythrorhizon]